MGPPPRPKPMEPHIALVSEENGLRPGDLHRVTCATREYRKPGVGRGAVHARRRRGTKAPVHPPGPLPAPRSTARFASRRARSFEDRRCASATRPVRMPCAPAFRVAAAKSCSARAVSRPRNAESPPTARRRCRSPSSAEPGRTTSPLTFLPRRVRFLQSGLDGVLAGTEPVEGVVDLGSGVAVAALAAIHIRETAPAPGSRPAKFRRPPPKRTDLARTRHLHLRDGR